MSTSTESTHDYRAHLDGLRTLAVYLVVAFHAGVARFAGGFIGVDVFFVLSGFLVTQVLLRDLGSSNRVRFGRFYARRFRRLLPASAVVLVSTLVAFSWVASPAEVDAAAGGFRAAFWYVANWHFVREATDYFAAGQAESPVLHFWSLAVEEQFYLGWPLILAGLWTVTRRAGRHSRNVLRGVVAAVAMASLGWAWYLSGSAPDRAYYGTDTRIYQLLAGALLALTPGLITRARRFERWSGPVAGLAVVGLVVVGTSAVSLTPVQRGMVACVLTVMLILGLERGPSPVRAVFSWEPMVYLGRISYGTYLWHWPVIVVAQRLGDFSPKQMLAVATVLSTGLAAASAELLERPFRQSPQLDRIPRLVVAVGLAVSLMGGMLVVERSTTVWDHQVVRSVATNGLILTPVPENFDQESIYEQRYSTPLSCDPETMKICTPLTGDGKHVVLVGDSNALMFQGAVHKLAKDHGLTFTLMAIRGCSWEPGYLYASHLDKREQCDAADQLFYDRILPELQPDLVVAVDVREAEAIREPDFTGTAKQKEQRSAMALGVEKILASGADLVVIEPLPRTLPPESQLNCLATATYQEECRFKSNLAPYWVEQDLRQMDEANERMWSVDMDRIVCPALPICDPYVNGMVARWDGAHLTRKFGESLADDLADILAERGLLDSR